jgi:hypothetical protein
LDGSEAAVSQDRAAPDRIRFVAWRLPDCDAVAVVVDGYIRAVAHPESDDVTKCPAAGDLPTVDDAAIRGEIFCPDDHRVAFEVGRKGTRKPA